MASSFKMSSLDTQNVAVINIGDDHSHNHESNNLTINTAKHHHASADFNHNSNHGMSDDADWKSHCHPNTNNKSNSNAARRAFRQLLAGTILCFLFMIAEIIGGALANSLAIMTGKTRFNWD